MSSNARRAIPAPKTTKGRRAAATEEPVEDTTSPVVVPAAAPAPKAPRKKAAAAAAPATPEAEAVAAPAAKAPRKKASKAKTPSPVADTEAEEPVPSAPKARKTSAKKTAAAAANTEAAVPSAPKARKTSSAKKTAVTNNTEAAVPSAPKARKTASASKKTSTKGKAAAAAAATAADSDAAASDTEEEPVAPAAAAPKQPRAPKFKPPFFAAFGDLHVPAANRAYDRPAFEEWKAKTQECLDHATLTTWRPAKKAFYKDVEQLNRRKKKVKPQDVSATAEKHLARLKAMNPQDFAGLDGAWLSNYKVGGKFGAEELDKVGCPNTDARCTYTVYQAAVFHGYQPLGIVGEETVGTATATTGAADGTTTAASSSNEETTKDPKVRVYTYPVEEDEARVYVGCSLPFKSKDKSPFAIEPQDRSYLEAAEEGQEETATAITA